MLYNNKINPEMRNKLFTLYSKHKKDYFIELKTEIHICILHKIVYIHNVSLSMKPQGKYFIFESLVI